MLTTLCSLLFAATLPNSKEELLFNDPHQPYLPGNCLSYSTGPKKEDLVTDEGKIIEIALNFLRTDSQNKIYFSNYWNPAIMRNLANYAVLKRNPTLLGQIIEYYVRFFQTLPREKEAYIGVENKRKDSDIEKMKAALYSMEMKNQKSYCLMS